MKNILITGASQGLGRDLAIAYARRGARVGLCARSSDGLEEVRRAIEAEGGNCLTRPVDVANAGQIEAWVAEVLDRWGSIDALLNNASLLGPREALATFPEQEWRAVIEVNLTGAFLVSRAVLPAMLDAGRGSIVNVSSGAAVPPRREWGAYAVSKSALETFSRNLAAEVEGSGVRVNIVDPGAMRTGMRAAAYPDENPETLKLPAEIFPLFDWLTSDAATGVSGERFQADEWLAERH